MHKCIHLLIIFAVGCILRIVFKRKLGLKTYKNILEMNANSGYSPALVTIFPYFTVPSELL